MVGPTLEATAVIVPITVTESPTLSGFPAREFGPAFVDMYYSFSPSRYAAGVAGIAGAAGASAATTIALIATTAASAASTSD